MYICNPVELIGPEKVRVRRAPITGNRISGVISGLRSFLVPRYRTIHTGIHSILKARKLFLFFANRYFLSMDIQAMFGFAHYN